MAFQKVEAWKRCFGDSSLKRGLRNSSVWLSMVAFENKLLLEQLVIK